MRRIAASALVLWVALGAGAPAFQCSGDDRRERQGGFARTGQDSMLGRNRFNRLRSTSRGDPKTREEEMAQSLSVASPTSATRLISGFVAGFIATLVFHQIGVLLLHYAGMTPNFPYSTRPVPPLHVPQFISLAFWGGVWGIVFVLAERAIARCPGGYWVGAIIFGAVFPTATSWFIVAPLKGLPVGYGFRSPGLLIGPIVNGLWGLGTAVFLGLMPGRIKRAW